ncbi:hypothetical protein MACK_003958 [Theileria orientalis]|uniref:RRM domain-containing protein n=1 Tax=Theileria orientalis TaxID=68886 RepID=A0A976SJN7_THEOR|nr:hypothetical protein MACK_003958 [Theileria orientalis]
MAKDEIKRNKNKNKFKLKRKINKEDGFRKVNYKVKEYKEANRKKIKDKVSQVFKRDKKDKNEDKPKENDLKNKFEAESHEELAENEDRAQSESYDTNDSRVVFIGNVPLTISTKSELVKKLKLDPRIVEAVYFRSLPIHPKYARNKKIGVIKKKFSNVKDNQNAYVKLTDVKYVDELLKKNTMEVDGHHIFVNTNNSNEYSKFSRKKTIFVGRLPPSANEDDLYNVFMNISPVQGVRIVRDPVTMRSKGFGFVAFDNRMAVKEAINEFNNTTFKGYTLNVTKCLDENKSKERKKEFKKTKKKGGNKKNKTT